MNVPKLRNQAQRTTRTRIALVAACAAPLALLSGCGPQDENAFAPACAAVGILGEAADYSDYGNGQPDLSQLISQGSFTAVTGHCSSAAQGTLLHTVVQVQMAVTRGPVATSRTIAIPYFIAVTRDGAVVSKQSLVAQAQFPDNGDKVLVKADPIILDLPVTRSEPGSSFRLEVGFQLTQAQLDYNRAHRAH